MILDLILIFGTDAFRGVFFKQGIDEIFAVIGDVGFGVIEEELAIDDILEHLLMVSVIERRRAVDHLVDEDTQRPPVRHEVLTLARDDLGTCA